MSQIKDIFFIKTILDRATAGSHNGETGYYSVSDNMFSEGHSCYCDNGNDYYSDLKGIFDCSSTLSGTNWSSSDQHEFDSGHYSMTIVKMTANNYLSILVGGQNVSLNYDGNYYYTQNYYSNYGGTWFRWDYINGELTYIKTYFGGSYATIDENVETTLYSSMPIMMYYNNADRNINYAQIAGDQGIGSGGWQVPNPNPTRKIVINGSEPDDIKLNGVTPDKIMLNGQCYFEKPYEPTYLYKWDFTKSLTDEIQGQTAVLSGATQDSNGLHISTASDYVLLGSGIFTIGQTMELDITTAKQFNTGNWGMLICRNPTSSYIIGFGFSNYEYWCSRAGGNADPYVESNSNPDIFNNKTVKIILNSQSNDNEIYANDSLIYKGYLIKDTGYYNVLGHSGNSFYNMTITGVRIYENEE